MGAIRTFALALAILLAGACAIPEPTGDASSGSSAAGAPSADDAGAFVAAAEERLLDLWIRQERAFWVQANFITDDTDRIAAEARTEVIAATMELAAEATRFDGMELPGDVARKLKRLKTSLSLVAPSDPATSLTVSSRSSRSTKRSLSTER